jgi:DNA-binding NarL/FixJ family response regulator
MHASTGHHAIRVISGQRCITARGRNSLAQQLNRPNDAHEQLSEREFQVFLVYSAKTAKILQSLVPSETVSTYRTRVMEKCRAHPNMT